MYHPEPEQDKLKHFDQFLINPNADNRKVQYKHAISNIKASIYTTFVV